MLKLMLEVSHERKIQIFMLFGRKGIWIRLFLSHQTLVMRCSRPLCELLENKKSFQKFSSEIYVCSILHLVLFLTNNEKNAVLIIIDVL